MNPLFDLLQSWAEDTDQAVLVNLWEQASEMLDSRLELIGHEEQDPERVALVMFLELIDKQIKGRSANQRNTEQLAGMVKAFKATGVQR